MEDQDGEHKEEQGEDGEPKEDHQEVHKEEQEDEHVKIGKGIKIDPIINFRSLDLEQPTAIMGPLSKDTLREWFSTYMGPNPPTLSGVYYYAHNSMGICNSLV